MKTQTHKAAARTVRRAALVARVSGISLIVLGGISFLFAVTNPLSAGFLISVAVVVNGFVEWRASRRLEALDRRAPGWLALNQLLLGLEIAAYSVWQTFHFEQAELEALLRRPSIKPWLQLFDPAALDVLLTALPGAIRLFYALVGVIAFLGCAATALYYLGKRKSLAVLLSGPPPLKQG
ncbi:MAG: hypothetical protein ACREIA_01415 [Opitutaceae bacterium]